MNLDNNTNSNWLTEDLLPHMPIHGDDIYVARNNGQPLAVASNKEIAAFISKCMNSYVENILNGSFANNVDNTACQHTSQIKEPQNISASISADNQQYSKTNANDLSNRIELYKQFIQDSYYLYVTMSKARIPITGIDTVMLQKAYEYFCISLFKLIKAENIQVSTDSTLSILNTPIQ